MQSLVATYVWIDGTSHIRCKYRTVEFSSAAPVIFPVWEFEGVHTYQTDAGCLVPVKIIRDPFSDNAHDSVVLCECVSETTGLPSANDTRTVAKSIFETGRNVHPMFALEQEYMLCNGTTLQPLKWDELYSESSIPKQNTAYCGVGVGHTTGRDIALEHYRACLKAGLNIKGLHAKTTPSQWAFQMGPLEGLHAGDELWLARYLLEVICEKHSLKPIFHPKPKRKFGGLGCHVCYSNDQTRQPEGLVEIMLIIQCLYENHASDMVVFGKDNNLRLTGENISAYNDFTYGVGDRSKSVCIPVTVFNSKCGFLEDRRPAANCDPYIVTATIHKTAIKV